MGKQACEPSNSCAYMCVKIRRKGERWHVWADGWVLLTMLQIKCLNTRVHRADLSLNLESWGGGNLTGWQTVYFEYIAVPEMFGPREIEVAFLHRMQQ